MVGSEPVDLRDRYTRHWRQASLLADIFWRRWLREYIPLLQLRQKWMKPQRNLRTGDFVLVIDYQSPKNSWMKGIVINPITSEDKLVRKVELKTLKGVITRDVRKVCLLEGVE
jgi:hypothetical protein